mmetsp:Transcript_3048/g.5986  ORF Transcript_3048/g.5986 Transcript_3048/m.5986 type:complete len:258 (-) Transcript_3048:295-1068(-)
MDPANFKVDRCSSAVLERPPRASVTCCNAFNLVCASSNPCRSNEHPLAILDSSNSCTILVAALSLLRTSRACAEVVQRDGGGRSGRLGTGEKNARTTSACSVNVCSMAPPSFACAITCKGVVPALLVTAAKSPTHDSRFRNRSSTSSTAVFPRTVASCSKLPSASTSCFGASILEMACKVCSRRCSTAGMEKRTAMRVAWAHISGVGGRRLGRAGSRHAPSCTSAWLRSSGDSLASKPATSFATSTLGLKSTGAATR